MITISIVSHCHGGILVSLLEDLAKCPEISKIVITQNVPEFELAIPKTLLDKILILSNNEPKGFGANHNAAFIFCQTPYYCVLNPDVRLLSNPFPALLDLMKNSNCSVCAPAVLGSNGEIEDSARFFPTLSGLIGKALGFGDGRFAYSLGDKPFEPDWIGGMFMLFLSEAFKDQRGFDEAYFLYYEDADICTRYWRAGLSVMLHPQVSVIHAARRDSHRKFRYMLWHAKSMVRYLLRNIGANPRASQPS